jgi:hypothetical protein
MTALNGSEIFQSAAAAFAAARLSRLDLIRRQRAHFSFLCVFSLTGALLSSLPAASQAYFYSFLFLTVAGWVASIWVVRDMFRLALSQYPGIQTAARWSLYASLVLSFLISCILTFYGPHNSPGNGVLYYEQIADRLIVFALAVVIAGLLWFLSHYPLRLSRNTYVSCSLFSAVFLLQSAVDMIDSFAPGLYSVPFETAEVLICGVVFLGWALVLQRESLSRLRPVTFDTPREDQLLRQLDAMNQLLGRVGRR